MPLLTYHFIDTFPVNINAVPMSYDGSTFLQVTVVFSYLRHTIEKHGNAQQSVNEAVFNSQLGQVNPIKPRRFVNELSSTSSSVEPTAPVGYVSGKPYYGPFHSHDVKDDDGNVIRTIKMVGAEHKSEPHPIIYDTIGESLPAGSTPGQTITETNPQTETETTAGQGTSQTTETTETTGGGTTTTDTTTTTTTTDSSGSTSSSTSSSSSSSGSSSGSGSSSSGSSYYGSSYYNY